jgi:hypothetical protein
MHAILRLHCDTAIVIVHLLLSTRRQVPKLFIWYLEGFLAPLDHNGIMPIVFVRQLFHDVHHRNLTNWEKIRYRTLTVLVSSDRMEIILISPSVP